jgi:putative component of toxin-antitoxin plasmid stabilization module
MYEIIHYLDENENDLYQDWLDGLRDRLGRPWAE